MSFSRILIANRGEIAVRIMRTAHALGYRTVAVYTDADAQALHVDAADTAVHIGSGAVADSYLNIEVLLDAARRSDADAVHPGYGFLSENADFARACLDAGLCFIGPSPDAIALMGSKRLAKLAMLEAGVPCVPGYEGADQEDVAFQRAAEQIGYPVMIKASAGGGGRGMRLVHQASELLAQLKTARSEARNAFGSDELILEKALIEPRHIEIQVFADRHGNTVYLGERDCSIQRRHQKVVEEAPSPFVDDELRHRMGSAAVAAAKACNYCGAGTVEFLVDCDRNFYFLEMNTRLQVEHPVTELITGQDLVAWQLKIAAGEALPLTQEDVALQGHAIEVRLYAEDAARGFMPQTGAIRRWQPALGEGVRIDHGLREGQNVSAHYDPMLAKLIAVGSNREEARRRLLCALEDTILLGINHNQGFLRNILAHPAFVANQISTAFLDHFSAEVTPAAVPSTQTLGMGVLLFYLHSGSQTAHNPDLVSWRNCAPAPWHYTIAADGERHEISLCVREHSPGTRYVLEVNGAAAELEVVSISDRCCIYLANGVRRRLDYLLDDNTLYLAAEQGNCRLENMTHSAVQAGERSGSGQILAPMDGAIIDIQVSAGDAVVRGQTLLVLEAMKMEHALKADRDGIVEQITTRVGAQVRGRQLLVSIGGDC